jgi:hypothetical protein
MLLFYPFASRGGRCQAVWMSRRRPVLRWRRSRRWRLRRRRLWWMIERISTREQWLDRKTVRAIRAPVVALPAHDTRQSGGFVEPETAGFSRVDRERRRLARRLADELSEPPALRVRGHDLVSVYAISVPAVEVAAVERAMRDSVVLPLQSPGSVWVSEGVGGQVLLAHGDSYSIVARLAPDGGPVLVLVDEVPGYAVRVDEDTSQRGRIILAEMTVGMMINLQAAGTQAVG